MKTSKNKLKVKSGFIKSILILIMSVALTFSCRESEIKSDQFKIQTSKIKNWFEAWELVSEDIFYLDTYQTVDFVFFDNEMVYSTSRITIPNGNAFKGPSILLDNLDWRYEKHNGQIKLPSGEEIPIGIMSFASPLNNQNKEAFFVMPLPSFWQEAGIESKTLNYNSFITGIFLHEFSHTQQMNTFGKKVSELEEENEFEFPLTDNIVQDYFRKDTLYVQAFKMEVSAIYNTIQLNEQDILEESFKVDSLIKARHQKYFTDSLNVLKPLDKLFLTMEGTGQFVIYEWLKHPKGGNLSEKEALEGARRGKWSQDEGLGLAIMLSKIIPVKEWGSKVFGGNTETLSDLIENKIKRKQNENK